MHPVLSVRREESKVWKGYTSSAIIRANALMRLVRDGRIKSQCASKSSRKPRIASVLFCSRYRIVWKEKKKENLSVSLNCGVLDEIASLRMTIGVS